MNLSGLVATISTADEEIVITKNGRPAAVVMSPDEYKSRKETIYIT
jgi:prevent-host-death family protein